MQFGNTIVALDEPTHRLHPALTGIVHPERLVAQHRLAALDSALLVSCFMQAHYVAYAHYAGTG
jgi:hypothetical protein